MAKNNFQKKYQSYNKEDAPERLTDAPFYNFILDEEQKKFVDAIYDPEKLIIACDAYAGTGKTTLSVGVADILVKYGFYDGIVYITSPTMEQKQGYLPGSQEEKNAPYKEPLLEALYTLGLNPNEVIFSEDNIQALKEGTAYIEFKTDTYLRGCNFERKIVIVDEAQNFYFDELKKTLTRIHDSCKLILIGHHLQCDLYKKPENSGFPVYLQKLQNTDDSRIAVCNLTINHRGWISNFCDNVDIDEYKLFINKNNKIN